MVVSYLDKLLNQDNASFKTIGPRRSIMELALGYLLALFISFVDLGVIFLIFSVVYAVSRLLVGYLLIGHNAAILVPPIQIALFLAAFLQAFTSLVLLLPKFFVSESKVFRGDDFSWMFAFRYRSPALLFVYSRYPLVAYGIVLGCVSFAAFGFASSLVLFSAHV